MFSSSIFSFFVEDEKGSALFSFQRKDASKPPIARKPMESSNGPVGPRLLAAAPASCPANIATRESPAYAYCVVKGRFQVESSFKLIICFRVILGGIKIRPII